MSTTKETNTLKGTSKDDDQFKRGSGWCEELAGIVLNSSLSGALNQVGGYGTCDRYNARV